jgi:kynureninase
MNLQIAFTAILHKKRNYIKAQCERTNGKSTNRWWVAPLEIISHMLLQSTLKVGQTIGIHRLRKTTTNLIQYI